MPQFRGILTKTTVNDRWFGSAVTDSNLTGHLNSRLTGNHNGSYWVSRAAVRFGRAERSPESGSGSRAPQSSRSWVSARVSLGFGSVFTSLRCRTLPKFADWGQEFYRQHEETALFPFGQPITSEQKMTDREPTNRKRERDGFRPIRARQMERDSPKKSTPWATKRDIEGGVPRFRNNLTGVSKNIRKSIYICIYIPIFSVNIYVIISL